MTNLIRRYGFTYELIDSLFAVIAIYSHSSTAVAEVVDIKTCETSIRPLIESIADSSYVMALFAGGHENVKISDDWSIGCGKGDFANKTSTMFQEQGITIVVVSTVINMGKKLVKQRNSDEYATDFGNVIAFLHDRIKKPVWVQGISRGNISMALAVHKIEIARSRLDGIILSLSVTEPSKNRHSFLRQS